jgi:ribulose-phosphate 3-epimerase
LGEEIASVERAGADWIHVDVMDGHFVPNLTIGPVVVQAIKPLTKLPLDCHLMISQPEQWVKAFADAGAAYITVHVEATHHLDRLLHQIRELGCKAGVSLNPATPVSSIEHVLDVVDLVLVMSVNPGFGGQKFIPETKKKVETLVQLRGSRSFLIQMDGGVSAKNISELHDAGVDCFVAGSAIFSAKDRSKSIGELRTALQ